MRAAVHVHVHDHDHVHVHDGAGKRALFGFTQFFNASRAASTLEVNRWILDQSAQSLVDAWSTRRDCSLAESRPPFVLAVPRLFEMGSTLATRGTGFSGRRCSLRRSRAASEERGTRLRPRRETLRHARAALCESGARVCERPVPLSRRRTAVRDWAVLVTLNP